MALLVLVIAIAVMLFLPNQKRFRKSAEVMYTNVAITVVAQDKAAAENAIDAAFESIAGLERSLSSWTNTSEIAAINRQAGSSSVDISPETFELTSIALEIARNTSGAFDPTVGPLMRLWDYRKAEVPSIEEIGNTLPIVDYRKLNLDPTMHSVYMSVSGMSFDTGGIAKGYAADVAVGVLKKHGISSGLVTIAGDIRAFGKREDGGPWKVGIRDPRGETEEDIIATLELNDEAVSTSGDYERFFIKDGKRYHHLVNPSTGYPAEGTMSFTVVAPKAVLTDGYATGAFVLGPQKGIEAIEQQGLEGMAISTDGKVFITEGLKNSIEWVSDRYNY